MTRKGKSVKIDQIPQGYFMKSQKQNVGELKEITVKIEKKVVEDLELMVKNTNIPMSDLVVIALKRFRSSHTDYLKQTPVTE
jgi:fructose-1,6-bisphosphatase/sedoheptulose 1,7-bisphosphatase-like protein